MTQPPGPSSPRGSTTGSGPTADRRLQVLRDAVQALVAERRDDSAGMLELLRELERLHRQIEQGPFRESLPDGRNALYQLLQDMERSGGWPYIPRPRLRSLLKTLEFSWGLPGQ
ncbi:MAG: hypothetical protein OXF25_03775 [Cyanobacteria bacterium MAG CAR3_bin_5]|nr:hypothetical protein [Cyanobacteria bacterium MAG CAR3_bin_5]MCY4235194.1 hypothetical protein [Cyanobacteria bacterium MAG CAR2_bin_4]MCY4332362.1 hypothetical protein [Cyanobacteria bacterium MAG CAR1_bin_15]